MNTENSYVKSCGIVVGLMKANYHLTPTKKVKLNLY
jgi:hypothetical protein